ncbi:GNAT family N-acetyltransferase [Celeribacter neptunius]|uniref:Protein N-acetyltransferase, RimJ/RimL family n=1 Tax=Celeribacter neptunius TaxID=588602 RepID=A0A1I3VKP2_9RHOB|nr:GNAT family N-acetyltransferase [Celeribacter neptunius]SFJ95948.1 Protein N-acetyltransferase, RimJ/RimL family [Celeribacter neptunius]
MSDFPEVIETADIRLRPMAVSDLNGVVQQLGEPETARWMAAARQPFEHRDAEDILAIGQDPAHRLRIVEQDGTMIGGLCLVPDLWFWLDRSARGHGIMSQALRTAITAHFARPAPPLIATCRDDNLPSQTLLSRLGFARRPAGRRMFFHVEGRALPCHDHVMTSGQWFQLHPPVLRHGRLTLRPAVQKDAATLMAMLPRAGNAGDDDGVWPRPEALPLFIELHRCRTPDRGLFVVEDQHTRVIAMVLRAATGLPVEIRYLSPEEAACHTTELEAMLARHLC